MSLWYLVLVVEMFHARSYMVPSLVSRAQASYLALVLSSLLYSAVYRSLRWGLSFLFLQFYRANRLLKYIVGSFPLPKVFIAQTCPRQEENLRLLALIFWILQMSQDLNFFHHHRCLVRNLDRTNCVLLHFLRHFQMIKLVQGHLQLSQLAFFLDWLLLLNLRQNYWLASTRRHFQQFQSKLDQYLMLNCF